MQFPFWFGGAMLDPSIPMNLQDAITSELEPGELIEWSGQPRPVFFSGPSVVVSLFGIPFTAFAIFWIATAATVPGGLLFGLPFLFVGLGVLTAPYWGHRKALNTVYAITNRRAITIDGGWATTTRSYLPASLVEIIRRDYRDGTGDVVLSRRVWRDSDGDRRTEELGFMRVFDAKDVERRLRQLASQTKDAL